MARQVDQRTVQRLQDQSAPLEQLSLQETTSHDAVLRGLLARARSLEFWGRAVAAAWFLAGGVSLVAAIVGPWGILGLLSVPIALALVVGGLWWAALHQAAAAHLRGVYALVRETQRQNAVLAELQEHLTK